MLCARISRAIALAVASFFLLVLKMCEKEAVLSALNAIMALNSEAGASNDSLEAMLTGVLEGRGKAAFDCFVGISCLASMVVSDISTRYYRNWQKQGPTETFIKPDCRPYQLYGNRLHQQLDYRESNGTTFNQ